jgi:hypothetical protein
MALLIPAPSKNSSPSTSPNSPKSTCSPEWGDGPMRSGLQGGQMTGPCGPGAVHVNLFPLRENGEGTGISGTSGLTCGGLLKGADLQSRLENRLQARMAKYGSPECILTWKRQDIKPGLQIYVLRGSPRPISETDTSLWPTPTQPGGGQRVPKGTSITGVTPNGKQRTVGIQTMLAIVKWPTPTSRDHFPAHTPEYIHSKRKQGHGMSNLNDLAAALTCWPTPTVITNTGGAALCKWGGTRSREKLRGAVGDTVLNGALNPEFVLWLMGYPPEWANYAPRAMR